MSDERRAARAAVLTIASAAVCSLALALCACRPSAESGAAAAPERGGEPNAKSSTPTPLTLKSEQVRAIGVATTTMVRTEHRDEVAGYGVVLTHDGIAQAVAERATAQATLRQSQAALARARSLAGSPGAVSADVQDAAARQASVDAAASDLAEQRLATIIGASPPWSGAQRERILQSLAAGRSRLVRATYPLGALGEELPATLRATTLGAGGMADQGWELNPVWPAPADANVLGRSLFALMTRPDAAEGERLMVYAPSGKSRSGVEVPVSAVVLSEGKYWCYLERAPGTYVRTEISLDSPTPHGYFVTRGVHPGDRVVSAAAAQLLAQESNTGGEPD